ncbi:MULTISPECIES: hypothetical protein [Prauserella salsuginis group]|uniref:Uncharacterized protein n=1 Tax=Prauserella salsuginis TaxID=387889 RepID=A0ABW6G5M0_9PSEU|nr:MULTISPECIES: hypothetical protein [Prauserella salsuginis group]MCR3719124.1 hypothetical protein [Prauserella flava]MCR3735863.1 hypothetical protein [Prauserella salsuginis]
MSDRLTSWVRTVVPALWAALIAWLAGLGLPEQFADTLGGLADELVVPAALAGVYALVRWAEPRLPRWLARILLGSSRPPAYRRLRALSHEVGGTASSSASWRG